MHGETFGTREADELRDVRRRLRSQHGERQTPGAIDVLRRERSRVVRDQHVRAADDVAKRGEYVSRLRHPSRPW